MTITELIRSTGEKIFLTLVALCLVGVFPSVSFAEEETPKPVPETSAAGTPPGKIERAGQATGKGIERGAKATERGVKRGVDATGRGIERGAKATERGVKRAGEATGKGIKKAGEAIEKTFSGD